MSTTEIEMHKNEQYLTQNTPLSSGILKGKAAFNDVVINKNMHTNKGR